MFQPVQERPAVRQAHRLLGDTLLGQGHAARQKKRYVYLFVNKSNTPAVNLYKKAGFTIVTETRIVYF